MAAASKGILDVEGETLTIRVVDAEVRDVDTFKEVADEQSVEADFKAASRMLTADLARKYADHVATEDEYDDGLFEAHVKVAALATVQGVKEELDRAADEIAGKWLDDHRVAIKGLSDERRAVYDEIRGMAPMPQRIEIKRPHVRSESTKDKDGIDLATRKGHLMADEGGNFPIGSLNQWEVEVLDKEMSRAGFLAWYRNPPRASADALAVAYESTPGRWRRMCPDFLFFHGDVGDVKVSIVDPHGPHLADALVKLKGLAKFAAEFGECFYRIESVAKTKDGALRVLDLNEPAVRAAVEGAEDAEALYQSECVREY